MSENPIQREVTAGLQLPGMTKDGGAWLAKALHPSDSVLAVNGVPTMEALPTAALNFMTTSTISAPADNIWGADIILNPSPVYFAKAIVSDGSAYGTTTIYNTQLATVTWSEFGAAARTANTALHNAWATNTQAYRLMYASITATLSASSTTDQGSVTCAQYEAERCELGSLGAVTLGTPTTGASRPCVIFPADRPSTAALQGTPGAVTWEARKGIYSVLKLPDVVEWHRSRDGKLPLSAKMTFAGADFTYPTVSTDQFSGQVSALNALSAASASDCTFGPQGVSGFVTITGTGATTGTTYTGGTVLEPTPAISFLKFTGLDSSASIVLTIRVGFEAVVQPTSAYIGQVSAPVPYDPLALSAYFRISRQMLAAYPAEYNALGMLFNVIKSAAQKALPYIGRFAQGALQGGMSSISAPKSNAPPTSTAISPIPQGRVQQVVMSRPKKKKSKKGMTTRRR